MDRLSSIAAELPFDELRDAAATSPGEREPSALAPESPVAPSAPSPAATITRPVRRGFAGFSYGQLLLGALLLAAAIWAMWATSKIFALDDRRVVSVRLAAIVNDFVTAEARSGTPPEQLAARTRAFMGALDTVLKKRAANGQVVLVGEAVVASSVPDVTMEVAADLGKLVKLGVPAAMPRAMMAPASAPQPAAPAQMPLTVPGPSLRSPFGAEPAQPNETVSQP